MPLWLYELLRFEMTAACNLLLFLWDEKQGIPFPLGHSSQPLQLGGEGERGTGPGCIHACTAPLTQERREVLGVQFRLPQAKSFCKEMKGLKQCEIVPLNPFIHWRGEEEPLGGCGLMLLQTYRGCPTLQKQIRCPAQAASVTQQSWAGRIHPIQPLLSLVCFWTLRKVAWQPDWVGGERNWAARAAACCAHVHAQLHSHKREEKPLGHCTSGAAHGLAHLSCGLVPNRPWPSSEPQPGDWGPLL